MYLTFSKQTYLDAYSDQDEWNKHEKKATITHKIFETNSIFNVN